MKIGVADRNIVTKNYFRCLSTFHIYFFYNIIILVDLVRQGSNDTESCTRVLLQNYSICLGLLHVNNINSWLCYNCNERWYIGN